MTDGTSLPLFATVPDLSTGDNLLTPSIQSRRLAAAAPLWPPKHDLFGVLVSSTSYADVVTRLMPVARRRGSAIVELMPVHSLVTAARDPAYRARINTFDIVCPDGQPVRWALNRFHRCGLADRVYGPLLMLHLCRAAEGEGVSIYLYGSTREVLDKLQANFRERFPGLRIAGAESPPFRPLTAAEDAAAVERINASGAGLVFLGLGCPRQEIFAFEHRDRIGAVQLCVGAAFDFHAGTKRMAPAWMQKHGLEWLFRFLTEPRRLARRYLVTNTAFALLVARQFLVGRPQPRDDVS